MSAKSISLVASFLVVSIGVIARERAGVPAATPAVGQSAGAGSLSGRITFEGTPPAPKEVRHLSKDPVCAAAHKAPVYLEDGKVNNDGSLPNAFVYIKSGAEKLHFQSPSKPAVLDQIGCIYTPHVLGVMVGQELDIISSDPTTHNVHVTPSVNPQWNHSQPPGGARLKKKFPHVEIMIPVDCNQHPWMSAYIGVTSNPFFAVSASDGKFSIADIPAGEYTLAVWTATFGTQERRITLQPGQGVVADFVFKAH
jgi:carboxypeptidase family protein